MSERSPLLRRRPLLAALLALTTGPAATGAALAAGGHDHSQHAAPPVSIQRSEQRLQPAAVTLQRADGRRVALASLLDDGRPVMLNFLYTSCTAICPVTAQVFAEVREQLGPQRDAVNVVSVSIDPEQDTVARLADYARRFDAGTHWTFLTGSSADSVAVQKSFRAYQGDKMNHVPVTFLRAAPGQPWVRLDGFATPRQLLAELRPMLAAPRTSASAR